MSAMWKSKKSEKWQKWIRSCLLASLHHLIPGLTRKKEENMGTASLIRYQNVFISFWTISRTILVLFAAHLLLPSRISQLFLDALASLKTMFKIQSVTDVFKILTNTRFKDYYRVLESIAEYYRV